MARLSPPPHVVGRSHCHVLKVQSLRQESQNACNLSALLCVRVLVCYKIQTTEGGVNLFKFETCHFAPPRRNTNGRRAFEHPSSCKLKPDVTSVVSVTCDGGGLEGRVYEETEAQMKRRWLLRT